MDYAARLVESVMIPNTIGIVVEIDRLVTVWSKDNIEKYDKNLFSPYIMVCGSSEAAKIDR